MIKNIIVGAFLILIVLFFIENPLTFKEFFKFSGEKIKDINLITGNTIREINKTNLTMKEINITNKT